MTGGEMTFEHDYARTKTLHRVVYIEYQDNEVFAVVTDQFDGYQNHFDFEMDCKDVERFMFYHNGRGGKITELQAPHYANRKSGATYWMHPDAKFKGKPINIKQIKKPIEYNGDPNPFNNGREIYAQNYCKFCNKWCDEYACPEHHVVNDNGELEYFDGSEAEN